MLKKLKSQCIWKSFNLDLLFFIRIGSIDGQSQPRSATLFFSHFISSGDSTRLPGRLGPPISCSQADFKIPQQYKFWQCIPISKRKFLIFFANFFVWELRIFRVTPLDFVQQMFSISISPALWVLLWRTDPFLQLLGNRGTVRSCRRAVKY